MKLLLIDVNCKQGSTGKIAYDLHTSLMRDGHRSSICFGRGVRIAEPGIFKFSSSWEVYQHALLTRLTGFTGYYSFYSTRKLIEYMDRYKPDLVHLHDLHAYFVNHMPVMNFLKKNGIKTVWTFHCEYMYTGRCGHAYECENWKTECRKCPSLRDYPSSFFFDFSTKMFNDKKMAFNGFHNLTIVTPSEWLAHRVRQSFLKDKLIKVVHNGIDTENTFHPRPFGHLKKRHNLTNEKIILAVAPDLMSQRKGGRFILELAKTMKNQNVKFILIGVKNVSETLDDNIIALTRTEDQNELASYYSMADAFLICSEKETFSMTCAEALCCGTPVIGFEAGAPESVFAKPYSVFVPYGDIKKLKESLSSLLSSSYIVKTECAAYGAKHFSNEMMYQKYLAIYQGI